MNGAKRMNRANRMNFPDRLNALTLAGSGEGGSSGTTTRENWIIYVWAPHNVGKGFGVPKRKLGLDRGPSIQVVVMAAVSRRHLLCKCHSHFEHEICKWNKLESHSYPKDTRTLSGRRAVVIGSRRHKPNRSWQRFVFVIVIVVIAFRHCTERGREADWMRIQRYTWRGSWKRIL